jgi:hypothetical protein
MPDKASVTVFASFQAKPITHIGWQYALWAGSEICAGEVLTNSDTSMIMEVPKKIEPPSHKLGGFLFVEKLTFRKEVYHMMQILTIVLIDRFVALGEEMEVLAW